MRGRVAQGGRTNRWTPAALVARVVLAALLLLGLGACSGGGSDGSAGDSDSADGGSVSRGRLGRTSDGSADSALEDGAFLETSAGRVPAEPRAVISTGEVDLQAEDLTEVRSEIDRLLHRLGGFVAREETHNDEEGTTARSTLKLRVPSQHFATVMDSFAELATVVDARSAADDVTTEVIDVASRIRTQEISLQRLRKFLGTAGKIADVIRLESAIANREADLASLRAQQKYLADQTSLATITVRMALPPEATAKSEDPLADAGFLTGLRNGWNALVDVAIVGATALGALLPFLVVLTLVGVPIVLLVRSLRRRRSGPVDSPGETVTPPGL